MVRRTGDVEVSWFDNPEKVDWRDWEVATPNYRKAAVGNLIATAKRRQCRAM
jgi:hypothetical protein